jgi:hypothetical protein
VLNQVLTAMIVEATRKSGYQIDRTIARPQQQSACIRRHQSRIERSVHSPAFNHSKIKPF